MKYFFVLFTLLLAVCCAGDALAQAVYPGKLTGSLSDSTTGQPVAYATVALMEGDSLRTGATTDEKGTFILANLPLGSYALTVSYIGYHSQTLPVLLTADLPAREVGTLRLVPATEILTEVTVTGRKAWVEDKGDRLIYHAAKDIFNAGGSAADVLRKVPTLSVDLEGNVQMRGNGHLKVLINGKPSAIMASNLAQALRQMPANSIKSVEVITSPGARYDAEGSVGVINLITHKALQGFSGSGNANGGNLGQGAGVNVALRTKKIGFSLSASGYRYRDLRESESVRTTLLEGAPLHVLTQRSNADNTGTGGYGNVSLDFDPDSTTRFNVSASFWGGNFPSNSTVLNQLTDQAGETLLAFRSEIGFRNPYDNGQVDLGYTKTFAKKEQEFSLLTQFSLTPNRYFYDTHVWSEGEQLTYQQKSTNHSHSKEYTFQTDYVHPFAFKSRKDTTSIKLEIGAKAILRDFGSAFRVEESADGSGVFIADPSLSDDYRYHQQVYSGYSAFRMNNKRNWNLNAGARLEHTFIRGDFVTTQTGQASRYYNLIPSLSLAKGIKLHTIKVSYTQRIQRPMIGYLNPWRNESDPRNVTTGNPYLKPELSHAAELSHSLNTNRGLSLYSAVYWRFTDNAIEYLSTVDTSGVSLSQPLNIAQRRTYGLNLNFSGQFGDNLYLNLGGDLHYLDLYSPAAYHRATGTVGNVYLNGTYSLPRNYTLQADGSYTTGRINIQGDNSEFYWYGFSVKHAFWDKKASMTLVANNPFNRGVKQTLRQSGLNFFSQSRSLTVNRSLRLDFEWRFGQWQAKGEKSGKKIKNDDKSGL